MVEAEIASDVDQFRDGTTSTNNAERGQHYVPADERSSEFVARSETSNESVKLKFFNRALFIFKKCCCTYLPSTAVR
jgi:hypothetical protein